MGRYRHVAQGSITTLVLVTILITTFLPDWVASSQAAPAAPNPGTGAAADVNPVDSLDTGTPINPGIQTQSFVPMNALVLSAPGQTDGLQAAITKAGDTVHVRQGDALFVGLDALDESALSASGARAIYRQSVSEADMAALSRADRDAAVTWNAMVDGSAGTRAVNISGTGTGSSVYLTTDDPTLGSSPSVLPEPTPEQTSVFLYGKVAVKVLFVETTVGPENWTEVEINKVKTEIVQGLDWWTVAATVPENPGDPARSSAQLEWDITYVSPFEGTTEERTDIQIGTDPLIGGVFDAATGWIPTVAGNLTGLTPDDTAVRTLADETREAAGADWGFVLFVVDSSVDTDGFFKTDLKMAGAALNGPWAVVTYDAGDMGTDNLEVVVAKMVGHVFGAGDEAFDPLEGGCQPTEIYGYLSEPHTNCERGNPGAAPSLMRDDEDMIDAYLNFQLSESARAQVGWRDADGDGIYDVVDTLSDTFIGISPDPVCPALHLAGVDIDNTPALTAGIVHVWDPTLNAGVGDYVDITLYTPVNINWPGFVWGRVNAEDWVGASPPDGEWDGNDDQYTITLQGEPGAVNQVEIAILDRWGELAYLSPTPVDVNVAVPPSTLDTAYESDDVTKVNLFANTGLPGGWTSAPGAGYSPPGGSGATMVSSGVGSEACFAFDGDAAKIIYNRDSDGVANVFVDGELHSTILYTNTTPDQAEHYVANLPFGGHTIQVIANSGVIDVDAFVVIDPRVAFTINRADEVVDFPGGNNGFYENTRVPPPPAGKLLFVGQWSSATWPNNMRPAPQDTTNNMQCSTRHYDRMYAYFKNANVAAIYRRVYPGGGTAYVYVDGEFRGIMNNDAEFASVMPFYIGGLDPAVTHSIEFRINPDVLTAPGFCFDALRLQNLSSDPPDFYTTTLGQTRTLPVTSTDFVAQERYGVWQFVATGAYIQANDVGDLLNVFFKGNAVAVLARTNIYTGGIMELYVDGRLLRTVNLKVTTAADAPIVLHGFDPNLPHVLQVRHLSTNATLWTRVDGFRVYYIEPVEPPPAEYEEYEYTGATPTRTDFIYEQKWTFPPAVTTVPGPSGNRFIQSAHPDARAYLYFTGADTLTLYGVAKYTYGSAELLVDGQLKGTFNLYSGATKYGIPYTITGMNPTTTHVLEVRIKNRQKMIAIDKVVLYNRPVLEAGTYQNDGLVDIGGGTLVPALQFSGQWKRVTNALASGVPPTYDLVSSRDDQVVFSVKNATSVVLYRRLYSTYGIADVYVDGKYHISFDNYISTPLAGSFQQPFVISGLDPGFNHEIKIVPRRFGTGLLSFKPFDVDYIVVRNGETAGSSYLTPGYYENNDSIALAGGAISYLGTGWVIEGDYHRLKFAGQKAIVVFEGNAFTTIFKKASNGGQAKISIDGKLVGTFSSYSAVAVNQVPFSVGGLSNNSLHTAEISVVTGSVFIDAYQVYQLTPVSGTAAFSLDPIDPRILVSEQWYAEKGYLKTVKKDAKLILYVTGNDSLLITHESWALANNIEVYVNGVLHSRLDTTYLRTAIRPEADFLVTGLVGMRTQGYWIEIRNPAAVKISLKLLAVGSLSSALSAGQSVEAEGTNVISAQGRWVKLPGIANNLYSGGFYKQSGTLNSVFYIPVQEGVRYVNVYRSLGSFADAKVFIDGVLWGTMPNKAAVLQRSVPFSVGPIPDTPGIHVVELRPVNGSNLALDRVVGHGLNVLQPGYYENDDPRFVYGGAWTKINNASASGGSFQRTTQGGARLAGTFMGNEISFIYRTSAYGGLMTAYIDGDPYPIPNRSALVSNKVKYTLLVPGSGPHSLSLVRTSGYLELDAIQIKSRAPALYGAYQNDSSQVVLNTTTFLPVKWDPVTATNHSGGTYSWTNDKYASAYLLFYGSRATVYMTQGKAWGRVSIYVDGVLREKVAQYANLVVDTPFYAYDISGLPAGNHVLQIRFEGELAGTLGQRRANFDVITVDGAPAPQPGETPGPGPNVPRFGCFEEDSPEWVLNGPDNAWTLKTDAGASGDQYYEGGLWEDVYAEFTFAAASFDLLYHTAPEGGNAEVFVDGLSVGLLDMAGSSQWLTGAKFFHGGLNPNIVHTVRIVQIGGGNIYLDRIDLPTYNSTNTDCPLDLP